MSQPKSLVAPPSRPSGWRFAWRGVRLLLHPVVRLGESAFSASRQLLGALPSLRFGKTRSAQVSEHTAPVRFTQALARAGLSKAELAKLQRTVQRYRRGWLLFTGFSFGLLAVQLGRLFAGMTQQHFFAGHALFAVLMALASCALGLALLTRATLRLVQLRERQLCSLSALWARPTFWSVLFQY